MKNILEYIGYKIFNFIIYIIPFGIVYFISDILAFILQYVVKYRKKIIDKNLSSSFPDISQKELKKIKTEFYKNISDIFIETLKSSSINTSSMCKRIYVENPDILDSHFENNRSCVFMMAHYANWEWIIFLPQYFKHRWCSIYKPLRNSIIDKKIKKEREKNGMYLYPQKQTGFMIKNNITKPAIFNYISDQSPATSEIDDEYWIDFLNKKTATISGAETIARKFDLPVYYLNISRYKRGHYKAQLIPIELNSKTTNKGEITTKYMNILESIIISKPENWLWSHNRWKKTKGF